MQAFLNKDDCIGCGLCPQICPEVFEMEDGEDKAFAKDVKITDELKDSAKEAEEACPVDAIKIS
ncbi:ferredoxin [Alkalicella caledoniensis]|uniref:Ferredoxin n=1 Tax=Alkalicella caledoniensis TaxID=2731377 RepID=A0A7G9W7F8_ALKCA|nr:ferredoxin [Alkalicella caledoniensis]QNO14620.1 ferredoxin [Alkalicella caledoniensis]